MSELTDSWIIPGLGLLADWSLRWGLFLLPLALWFALRPPQRAATRHLLCAVALAAGLLLPVMPRWRVEIAAGPARPASVAAQPGARSSMDDQLPSSGPFPPAQEVLGSRPSRPGPGVVRPPSEPAPGPMGGGRLVAIGIAASWALAVLLLSARLVGGRLLLARMKAQAMPCGAPSRELLDECRRALGLSRPTTLAVHPAISSPVVIGGRRPMILVPPDWDGWPEPHRRDCLRHELTHLRRHDDRAKFIQELVIVPFFFHPLVRWLLKRLDRERELLCDEAVVALGGDPVGYARLLLDLARRPGRLLLAKAALRPGWLPFFDRGTVAVRIERLLEDDVMRSLSPPSPRRLFAMGALALAAALGIGGLQVRAAAPGAKQDNPPAPVPARAEPKPEPKPADAKQTRTIEGRVLDAKDKPAAGVVVVAGFTGSGKPNHRVFKTDQDGRFVWPIPDGSLNAALVAYKEGRGPAIWSRWLAPEVPGEHVELTLAEAEPFEAVLSDEEGRPTVAARVRLETLVQSYSTPGEAGVTHTTTSYTSVPLELIGGGPLESQFETTTDRTGAFLLPASLPKAWLARGEAGLKLGVTTADGRAMRVRAAEKPHTPIGARLAEQGFIAASAGRRNPSLLIGSLPARLAGRVTTTLPGVDVAGLTISFQDSDPEKAQGRPRNTTNRDRPAVQTGKDGRFVVDGLTEGTINVFVRGNGNGDTWTYRDVTDVRLRPGETTDVTLELIRGVEVGGIVVAKETGRPVEGAEVAMHGPHGPRSHLSFRTAKTDDQGRFRSRLPSGAAYFTVFHKAGRYRNQGEEDTTSRTVTIPEDANHYDVPRLEQLTPMAEQGRIFDAQGSPVVGARLLGLGEANGRIPWPGPETLTDASGTFALPTDWHDMVPIGQSARLQIRLRDGSEQEADAIPTIEGSYIVKLTAASTPPNPDRRSRRP